MIIMLHRFGMYISVHSLHCHAALEPLKKQVLLGMLFALFISLIDVFLVFELAPSPLSTEQAFPQGGNHLVVPVRVQVIAPALATLAVLGVLLGRLERGVVPVQGQGTG